MVDLNYQNALISADRPSVSPGHECFLKKKPKARQTNLERYVTASGK